MVAAPPSAMHLTALSTRLIMACSISFQPGAVQQIVEQVGQQIGVGFKDSYEPFGCQPIVQRSLGQRFRVAFDRGQRRRLLVRDVGDEVPFYGLSKTSFQPLRI